MHPIAVRTRGPVLSVSTTALVSASLALLTVGAASAAHAAPTLSPAAGPPSHELLDVTARPLLDWSVPDRYAKSWAAYDPARGTYNADYAAPARWSVTLDACSSTSRHPITSFTFLLTKEGSSWRRGVTRPGCRIDLDTLPSQGTYRASLTLRTTAGVSASVSSHVGIRDLLVVSLGDSLASGEGNPDEPRVGQVRVEPTTGVSVDTTLRPAVWKDRRCHRSALSGPARAAADLERVSRKTSVTFLSLACSGATIAHLVDKPYGGIEPIAGSVMPPQVEALAALVGPRSRGGGRPIDKLLISAGVNDLRFSEIIDRCVRNSNRAADKLECARGPVGSTVGQLPARYDALASALTRRLPSVRATYLNDYPSEVFDGGGCDMGNVPGWSIDAAEAGVIAHYGRQLNRAIVAATARHRARGWNFVGPGLTEPFRDFAYCDRPSMFVSYDDSYRLLGNKYGTAHPNAQGHRTYAAMLLAAVDPAHAGRR